MSSYLLANWKSHKTLREAEAWLEKFHDLRRNSGPQVIVAPPMPFLAPMRQIMARLKIPNLALAAQDISPFPQGSYTGAVAAPMISEFADYAIVGHSERRRYFHETNQEVANKVSEAVAAGLKPILCVDLPYARQQLAAINEDDFAELIIGYGPVSAAGMDFPQALDEAGEAITEIRAMAPDQPIFYGGSINGENAAAYMNLAGVSGLMVGSASLDPEGFAAIGAGLVGA
ncbi:MAG: triose-phosphate isomerase [Desulfurivibrionaceae bacterium]